MLSAESLDELLEAGTAPGDALKIYCAISTAKKWQAFEKTPALDARDRENAAAVLASEPTARAMRATLLGMGVKPRKYNEEEMQAALKQIAARGRVGLLRGPRAASPDPQVWDRWVRSLPGRHMCVWEGKVVGVHLFGAHTHPLAMPPKTRTKNTYKGNRGGKTEVPSPPPPKRHRPPQSRASPRVQAMRNRTPGTTPISATRAGARLYCVLLRIIVI